MAEFSPRRALFLILVTALATLAGVAGFNYAIDPAAQFDDGRLARANARLLLDGSALLADNADDRQLQREYARSSNQAPELLVLGSSRMMLVDQSFTTDCRLYNGAVSSMTLPDLLAMGELWLAQGLLPRRLVLGVDHWLLDPEPRNSRWRRLGSEHASMAARLGLPGGGESRDLERWLSLVSLATTTESARWLTHHWRDFPVRAATAQAAKADETEQAVKRPDGSLVYPRAIRERSVEERIAFARQDARGILSDLQRAPKADPGQLIALERFLTLLKGNGVEVVLALVPYAPAVTEHLAGNGASAALSDRQATMTDLGARLSIPVVGGYDPAPFKCGEADFLDGVHAEKTCLKRALPPEAFACPPTPKQATLP